MVSVIQKSPARFWVTCPIAFPVIVIGTGRHELAGNTKVKGWMLTVHVAAPFPFGVGWQSASGGSVSAYATVDASTRSAADTGSVRYLFMSSPKPNPKGQTALPWPYYHFHLARARRPYQLVSAESGLQQFGESPDGSLGRSGGQRTPRGAGSSKAVLEEFDSLGLWRRLRWI